MYLIFEKKLIFMLPYLISTVYFMLFFHLILQHMFLLFQIPDPDEIIFISSKYQQENNCSLFIQRVISDQFFLLQIQYILLFSRQGKLRLQKWYTAMPLKEKKKIARDLTTMILARKPKMSSFLEYKDLKIVYKR